MTELLKNAVTGVNIIPTVLLGLVVLYWIIAIIGVLDFDFLDLDFDLDGADDLGPFYAILAFINASELPFMLLFSIIILNFWIIAMLIYYLPIVLGGFINGVLLIPAIVISMFVTKYETIPLKGIFKSTNMQDNSNEVVIGQRCTLMCNVENQRLGQAEIKRDGASIVINVKSEFYEESFEKDEVAFVSKKHNNKNIYYIIKIEEWMK